MKKYEFHEYANAMPLIDGIEFEGLVSSIKEKGLQHPIVLFEGKILDGRNRYRACIEAGVKPKFIQYKKDASTALDFVRTENIDRRHLTESQRAMAGNMLKELRSKGIDVGTNAEIAERLNVSERLIKQAGSILKSGNKELIAEVASGKKTVGAAVKEGGVQICTGVNEKNGEIKVETPKVDKKVESIYNEDFQEAFGLTDEKAFEELVISIRNNANNLSEALFEIISIARLCSRGFKQMSQLLRCAVLCKDFGYGCTKDEKGDGCTDIDMALCSIWKNRFADTGVGPGVDLENTGENNNNSILTNESLDNLDSLEELESENGILKNVDLKPIIEVERVSRDMVTLEQPKIVLPKPGAAKGWDKPKEDINDIVERFE